MKYFLINLLICNVCFCSCSGKGITKPEQALDTMPTKMSFDSFYHQLNYIDHCKDSILIYNRAIDSVVSRCIADLETDSLDNKQEKQQLIGVMLEYKKNYKIHLLIKEKAFYSSYGTIPTEKGDMSCRYYFLLLKNEYSEMTSIIDNIYHSILAH
jgi:hypothetical protein